MHPPQLRADPVAVAATVAATFALATAVARNCRRVERWVCPEGPSLWGDAGIMLESMDIVGPLLLEVAHEHLVV